MASVVACLQLRSCSPFLFPHKPIFTGKIDDHFIFKVNNGVCHLIQQVVICISLIQYWNLSNQEASQAGGWGDPQTSLEVLSPTTHKVARCVSFPGSGDPHIYALVFGVVRRDSDLGNLEMVSVVPWGAETRRGAGRNWTSFELASSWSPLESVDTCGFGVPLGPLSPPAGGRGLAPEAQTPGVLSRYFSQEFPPWSLSPQLCTRSPSSSPHCARRV